ncbi:FecR family protein [Filimonas lacunae]|uniref:FecR family protein n=1 Tax=Filimonas lacunae TaxID=477680 RepID=A0A173MHS7_9BACT|nr:FecR family protein [Filimonas lacunae]BAV07172.1 anti-sigma factor [Filimonas lacunae]SIS93824.1 FecR family protein [Filimonas lacunae]
MEENKRLRYLLNRYVTGTCTPEEDTELMQLLADAGQEEWVKEYMAEAWSRLPGKETLDEAASERIRLFVLAHHTKVISMPASSGRNRRITWAAAAVMVLLAGSLLYAYRNLLSHRSTLALKPGITNTQDVAPGTDGAVLTLADGSTIILDSIKDGSLSRQGNINIVKKDGKISYVSADGKTLLPAGFNTVGTARGKQFQLVLEDGTRVWLNAASSIRYPVAFADSVREVEITGEAYFDVAKNKQKPFRVKANGTSVEVLGTQFNINAYSDEAAINTTLLEGAVRVKKGSSQQLLAPGQQAKVSDKGEIVVQSGVNTSEITAWKNNFFSFNNTDIHTLMRQLSRWYDVEVVLGNYNSTVMFNGDISRAVNLSTVLKMLELTGEVHFTIEGKTIIVNK